MMQLGPFLSQVWCLNCLCFSVVLKSHTFPGVTQFLVGLAEFANQLCPEQLRVWVRRWSKHRQPLVDYGIGRDVKVPKWPKIRE